MVNRGTFIDVLNLILAFIAVFFIRMLPGISGVVRI